MEVQEVKPGAGGEAASGEPERAVRSLTTGFGDSESWPRAAQEQLGMAAGRKGVEPELVSGDDDDEGDEEEEGEDEDGGVAVKEAADGTVTSCPSRDP